MHHSRLTVRARFILGAAVLVGGSSLAACFGSSSSPGAPQLDAALDDAGSSGGAGPDATTSSSSSGGSSASGSSSSGASSGGDGGDGGPKTCLPSTCPSVEVVFSGWITGADGGNQAVQLAVDEATADGGANAMIRRTTSTSDPALGKENLLVGDFVTVDDAGTVPESPLYANDNNGCDVPDFAGRSNAYFLAPMQGLPIDPTWLGSVCGCGGPCGGYCLDGGASGVCDHVSTYYSQSCPNFGGNCVDTPKKIESIQVVATGSDATCEVCFYDDRGLTTPSVLRCVAPGTTLSLAELEGDGGQPLGTLRLDDGTNCASY